MMRRKATKPVLPKEPTVYPVGSFVRTEKGYFYIAGDKRYFCITKRVVDSWRPARIIESTEAAVKHLPIKGKLHFRNASLITDITTNRVYLVENNKRRLMSSPEAFWKLGIDPRRRYEESVDVSLAEINLHTEGEPYV